MSYITVEVDVDIDDALEAATDREIKEEYDARKLGCGVPDNSEIASNAINMIRLGRLDDAILFLEREFMPKWSSIHECEQKYRLDMSGA